MRGHMGVHSLWSKLPVDRICYADDYEQAGFHKVKLENFSNWNQIHAWCEHLFGDNYS